MVAHNQLILCPMLIGRALELRSIKERIDAAGNSQRVVACIAGEAGVGKTRLVSEATAYARDRGCVVLCGNCVPHDEANPYALIVDLLRRQFGGQSPEQQHPITDPIVRELALLLPGVVPLAFEPSAPTPPHDPETHKRRLFAAFSHYVLHVAAHQPLVLVCEDLHWCDEASLSLLHHLISEHGELPLMLLATYRSEEASPLLHAWCDELNRKRLLDEIVLHPLPAVDVEQMLRAIFDRGRPIQADFLEVIYRFTEGNPFFVEETLKSLAAENALLFSTQGWSATASGLRIPQSVQDAVQRRVVRLSATAREVNAVAAVVGRSFYFDLLQQVLGLDEVAVIGAIKELIGAQLVIEETSERFAFRHALTREAILAGLLRRERRALHQTVAATIERGVVGPPEHRLADLAYHSYEGGLWEQALAYGVQAGVQARRLYAPRAAVELLTRAIAAAQQLRHPSTHLYRERGLAYETLGDFAAAEADYTTALDLARGGQDQRAEWQALLDLGHLWASRDYGQTGVYYQQALILARSMGDGAAVASSLNRIGNWHVNIERPNEAIQLHEEALAIFEGLGDQERVADSLDLLAMALSQAGDTRRAFVAYQRAITLFRLLDNRYGLASALATVALLGGIAFNDMTVPAGQEVILFERAGQESLQIARDSDWRGGEAYALLHLGNLMSAQGRYGLALHYAESSLATAEAIEHRQWMIATHCGLGQLYGDLLALPVARQHAEQACGLAQAAGSVFWQSIAAAQLARICIAQQELARAEAVLDELRLPAPPQTFAQRQCWGARAELALASDDADTTLAIADILLRSAANCTGEGDIPRLALLRGLALMRVGRTQKAEAALHHGEQGALVRGLAPLRWRIHAALAQLYLVEQRRHEAEDECANARGLIEELGRGIPDATLAEGFMHNALALLPLAPPQQRTLGQGLHELTPRENEVLDLIAAGKSNQEIATALVLSIRTVERHISTIYEKLGLSGRAARASATAYAMRRTMDDRR